MLAGAASGPSGHALFVRNWRRVFPEALDVEAFAARYAGAGFSWIGLLVSYKAAGATANRDAELGRALERAGVAVWSFWDLTPSSWRGELPRFLEWSRELGAGGLIVNPERQWIGRSNADARAFGRELEAARLPIIVATYGTPSGFPRFPWAGFAEIADVGMPLLFDRDLGFSAEYFARGLEQWHARGFEALDVAGSTWAHRGSRSKTVSELARHLLQLPRTPATALWAPVALTPAGLELLEAWNRGDRARLEELGRTSSRVLAGRPGRRRASGSGADGVAAVLALAGLAGAAAVAGRGVTGRGARRVG